MSGENGKYHQTVTDQTSLQASSRAARDIDWYFEKGFKHRKLFINIHGHCDKKVKTKNFHGCFEINSLFRTLLHWLSPRLVMRWKHGSSYRGQNYIERIWGETKITSS